MSQHKVVLLLGSNLGDKDNNIKIAINELKKNKCKIKKYSKMLTTEPVGFVSNNNFRNIAVEIETKLSPIKLLRLTKNIEKEMGRKEDSSINKIYKDRIIDIDIVIYNSLKYKSKNLEIPHHKNLYERDFSIKLLRNLSYKNKHNI